MKASFLKDIEQQLLLEVARLRRAHQSLQSSTNQDVASALNTPASDDRESEDENAAEIAEFSDNLSVTDDIEKALRDAEDAVHRIQTGTYGMCKYCKKPIDERRLLARPTSSSCVECKKTFTQEM